MPLAHFGITKAYLKGDCCNVVSNMPVRACVRLPQRSGDGEGEYVPGVVIAATHNECNDLSTAGNWCELNLLDRVGYLTSK